MESQNWKGMALDKDLLVQGNTQYSPDKCLFVSRQINNILCDSRASRGGLPIGVSWKNRKSPYVAHITKCGKVIYIGCFKSPDLAHAAWQKAKAEIMTQLANEQEDERVKSALMQRIYQLRDDLANGRETVKL